MPNESSVATFNEARRTGLTKTTRALQALFDAKNPALVASLRASGPMRGLPGWARSAFASQALSEGELDHIRDWPDDQKERARAAISDAWDNNDRVQFLWKLWDNPNEGVTVRKSVGKTMIITFFSPWDKMRTSGEDNIVVDV